MSELDGKDINEVISEGMGKLASMPSGTTTTPLNCYVCYMCVFLEPTEGLGNFISLFRVFAV